MWNFSIYLLTLIVSPTLSMTPDARWLIHLILWSPCIMKKLCLFICFPVHLFVSFLCCNEQHKHLLGKQRNKWKSLETNRAEKNGWCKRSTSFMRRNKVEANYKESWTRHSHEICDLLWNNATPSCKRTYQLNSWKLHSTRKELATWKIDTGR